MLSESSWAASSSKAHSSVSKSIKINKNCTFALDLPFWILKHVQTADIDVQSSFPAPTAPPGQVSAKATSSTSLLVTWSAVPEQHSHGKILLHHVYISHANNLDNYRSFPAQHPTQLLLANLQAYTLYAIRVSAKNNIGEGPKSAPLTARTMEGGKISYKSKLWDGHYT